jgi:hypothetical protein
LVDVCLCKFRIHNQHPCYKKTTWAGYERAKKRKRTFVFSVASNNSLTKPTAFVLAYSLSRNPWSHVLTLYLSTCCTIFIRPCLPALSSWILRSSCSRDSSFLGGWCSTSAVRGPPPLTSRPWPVCFVKASWSAEAMNGMIRSWTAVRSYQIVSTSCMHHASSNYMEKCCRNYRKNVPSYLVHTSLTSSARLRGVSA